MRFYWRDNNGKEAQVRLRTPDTTLAGAEAQAFALASALQAVSDAALFKLDLSFKPTFTPGPAASPMSDARSYALLFYRNDDRTTSIQVPSPAGLPTETAGAYAGVRVTRELLELSGLLGQVESLPAGLVDGLGRPLGTAFSIGGIVKL